MSRVPCVVLAAFLLAATAAAQDAPFVPRAGEVIHEVALAGPYPIAADSSSRPFLQWNADGTQILIAYEGPDLGKPEGGGYARRRVALFAYDLATKELRDRGAFEGAPGQAYWLAGDRLLLTTRDQTFVQDADGTRREIVHGEPKASVGAFDVMVASEGRHVAFKVNLGGQGERSCVGTFVLGAGEVAPAEVVPFAAERADPASHYHCAPARWDGGVLVVSAVRAKVAAERRPGPSWTQTSTWETWCYDTATQGLVARAEEAGHAIGAHLPLALPEALDWRLPGGRLLRRRIAPGWTPPEVARRAGREEQRARAPVVAALELLDSTGKLERALTLGEEVRGRDAWPVNVSADGTHVLVATCEELRFEEWTPGPGTWRPVIQRCLAYDLATGAPQAGLELTSEHLPATYGFTAVMAGSREVLVVDTADVRYRGDGADVPNPTHGIWRHPFSGGRENLAPGLGLADSWVGELVPFEAGGPDPSRRRVGWDRVALVTRPQAYLRGPGPRRLLVFWNQATPLVAMTSVDVADAPSHVAWDPRGTALAFTSGTKLLVWRPVR